MRTRFPSARGKPGNASQTLPVELNLGTNIHVMEHPRQDMDDLFAINAAKPEFLKDQLGQQNSRFTRLEKV